MADSRDVGIIGAGALGGAAVRRLIQQGLPVVVYDRDPKAMAALDDVKGPGTLTRVASLRELVTQLSSPRRILAFLPPTAVDEVIASLAAIVDNSDVIADCSDSHFSDAERRASYLAAPRARYLGVGVANLEPDSLDGACFLAGGHRVGYEAIQRILSELGGRTDGPGAVFLGNGGAGLLAKMVHNGILYVEVQAAAELFHLLRTAVGLEPEAIAKRFSGWNTGIMEAHVSTVMARIIGERTDSGSFLVDTIQDEAGHSGTGIWAAEASFGFDAPVPLITAAVEARQMSVSKAWREVNAIRYPRPPVGDAALDVEEWSEAMRQSLLATRLLALLQAFHLARSSSEALGYGLSLSEMARMFRTGTQVRCAAIEPLLGAFSESASANLFAYPRVQYVLAPLIPSLRKVVILAVQRGIPVHVLANALNYFDSLTTSQLPANLVQAARSALAGRSYANVLLPPARKTHNRLD